MMRFHCLAEESVQAEPWALGHEDRKRAIGLAHQHAVHGEHRVDIGHGPTPVHHLAAAFNDPLEHRLEVIDLDLDGRTSLLGLQYREQRGAHAGVRQREQGRAVHGALRVEVHRLHLQRE
jgi:hypothetical protein